MQEPPSKNVEKIYELYQHPLKATRTTLSNHLYPTYPVRTKQPRRRSSIGSCNHLIDEITPIPMPDSSIDEVEKEEFDIYSSSFLDDGIKRAEIIIEMLAIARVIVKIIVTSFCTKYAR
jgi:hypothetical protein